MQLLKELLVSANSGLFGRLLLVLIGAGGGFTIGKVLTVGSSTTTAPLLVTFNFAVVCSMIGFFRNLSVFKEWSRDRRQDEIRKLELKKEILELEMQRNNQQSTPNNEE